MTKRFSEILTLLVTVLAACAGLPSLMYYLSTQIFFKGSKSVTLFTTLTVSLTLLVLFVIYIVMLNVIKIKHYDVLLEGRAIIDKIAANKRQMRAIRNTINRDKDESVYGLDKYDDKLAELEKELNQISEEKQAAMTQFENETKQLLTNEVNDRRLPQLEAMKENVEEIEKQIALLEDDIMNSDLAITNNYGAVLGKEFCTPAKVADLISLMEDGTADTVSEAIAAYKGAGR